MAEPPSTHHRHAEATSRREGGENQRDFIADSTCGMFVHLRSSDLRQLDDTSGAHHGFSQPAGFLRRHALEHDCHEQRTGLIVPKVPGDHTVDKLL